MEIEEEMDYTRRVKSTTENGRKLCLLRQIEKSTYKVNLYF
jgi:hypothetical protein